YGRLRRHTEADEARRMELTPALLNAQVISPPADTLGLGEGLVHYFPATLTVSRLRPFWRRRDRTWRPPPAAMRARQPWVRRGRVLWGWYVRFTGISSISQVAVRHQACAASSARYQFYLGAVKDLTKSDP